MKNKYKISIAVSIIIIIILLAFSVYLIIGKRGVKAPDFTLTDVNGNTFSLSDFRGKVVILDFMATWCGHCRELMSTLKSIHETYPEVVIISIDIATTETNQQLKEFKAEHEADWIFAIDTASEQVSLKYDAITTGIPKTVIINPDGEIAFAHTGLVSYSELSQEIEEAKLGLAETIFFNFGLPLTAFIAGVLSFFSPCSFPLLPGYIAYYVGREEQITTLHANAVKRGFIKGVQPALGILVFYSFIGILLVFVGSAIRPHIPLFELGAGILIIILGIVLLFHIPFLAKTCSKFAGKVSSLAGRGKKFGLFFYGVVYGAAATGCTAPVFIAIIVLGIARSYLFGTFIFLLYAAGVAILMILVTILVALAKDAILQKLKLASKHINKICGMILIVVGIYLVYYYFSVWW
ncbi:MAG: cytochrome c biogenesis protein CcdA [Candidatus Thermoplasmatota archaeon]|nr:cytochrome c biogenesis protein CcdA [Candidatus Thermoplasmatota archaeon]